MAEFCLTASHGYPSGLVFHPELGSGRISKDCQQFWHSPGSKNNAIRLEPLNGKTYHVEEQWKPISGLSEAPQFVEVDSTIRRLEFIDVQGTDPNTIPLNLGIAGHCARQEEILQFLRAPPNEVGGVLDSSMDLTGLQNPFTPEYSYGSRDGGNLPSLFYPSREFYSQRFLEDLAGNLALGSEILCHPEGQIPLSGVSPDLKDILSIVAGYYLSKNGATKGRKESVIPYFNSRSRSSFRGSTLVVDDVKFAPLKSVEKIKQKSSQKKKADKGIRESDIYKRNYFHAWESLMSVVIDKKHNRKTAMLSLKKSGPELTDLLTQFSASIAGTGLAVLFSVIYKVAGAGVPFCSYKLFNTGIGLGLVWLSWAVNRLRDTVVTISKSNNSKASLNEEETLKKMDKCANEIFFRAATLMGLAVLRLV